MISARSCLSFVICMTLLIAISGCCGPPEPTLVDQFHEHRSSLEELRSMFSEDAHLVRVAWDFTVVAEEFRDGHPPGWSGLSEDRWDSYRALFRRAELEGGIVRRDEGIFFAADPCGLVFSGRVHGFAYLQEPPKALSVLGDDLGLDGTEYVPIDGRWYLFSES